jgi:hypothetical protein
MVMGVKPTQPSHLTLLEQRIHMVIRVVRVIRNKSKDFYAAFTGSLISPGYSGY